METERAPGRQELMTRGPDGSAVRSSIASDGTGLHQRAGRARPRRALRWRTRGPLARSGRSVDDGLEPAVGEEHEEGDRYHPHQGVDLARLAANHLQQDPADEPG